MSPVMHTLPDDVLLAYSTGQLPEAFDLVVAAHCSLSDDSRAALDVLLRDNKLERVVVQYCAPDFALSVKPFRQSIGADEQQSSAAT